MALRQRQFGLIFAFARGCRTQPGVSTPGITNQLSVVGGQLSGGI
jgi:hypothetical protein